jgi:hypothetical protein
LKPPAVVFVWSRNTVTASFRRAGMVERRYTTEQVLDLAQKVDSGDDWSDEEKALLSAIFSSALEAHRSELSPEDQGRFDAEMTQRSEGEEVQGYTATGVAVYFAVVTAMKAEYGRQNDLQNAYQNGYMKGLVDAADAKVSGRPL